MRDRPHASLVWDGDDFFLPPELGTPRQDQLLGSTLERLIETAGRTCYDSFGTGRATLAYHEHLLDVGHLSVHEHATFTLELLSDFEDEADTLISCFRNRPQCWVRSVNPIKTRVTLNLRSVLEWDYWTDLLVQQDSSLSGRAMLEVGDTLRHAAANLAPCIVKMPEGHEWNYNVAEPDTEDEKWVALFLAGSRGLSHEQVRHGDFTAISQRSTRFVDETETAWVTHPLLKEWLYDRKKHQPLAYEHVIDMTSDVVRRSRTCYATLVDTLEKWLVGRGVDKTGARKQARGASRGYLGNALYTEMVFTASVRQWKRMLKQRASVFADAEIREAYAPHVLAALKQSRYADCFADWTISPSPDGIGLIAREIVPASVH